GDIVVDQDRLNLNAIGMGQLGGGFEVEDIASVVLDDEQDAFAAVYGLGALVHLVGSGGREDFAGAGAVKHAHAHESTMHWLMPTAATRDHGHLACHWRIR